MILAIIFGIGIANNGFCVRITIVVVAIYNGIVVAIIKLNVNPPRPRKCACDMRIQSARENISNPNNICKIAHVTNIYPIVQINGILHFFKKSDIVDIFVL